MNILWFDYQSRNEELGKKKKKKKKKKRKNKEQIMGANGLFVMQGSWLSWFIALHNKIKQVVHLSSEHHMTKPKKRMCAQRRFRSAWASALSDQCLLCAQRVARDQSFLHADSKDSDQTGRMPRLIWVVSSRTSHTVGFVMRWLICC